MERKWVNDVLPKISQNPSPWSKTFVHELDELEKIYLKKKNQRLGRWFFFLFRQNKEVMHVGNHKKNIFSSIL